MKVPVEESDFIYCDVQDIVRVLRRTSSSVAERFVLEFRSTVALLSSMSGIGRPRPEFGIAGLHSWRIHGLRKYLIFYEDLTDRIRLLRVLHDSRDLQSEIQKAG
jgi:plasmid stabilization system protein ParE